MSKPYVIGIDIGGTNSVFGIVDARGVVIASSSIKTQKHNNIDDYINELYTETMRLVEANDAVGRAAFLPGYGQNGTCQGLHIFAYGLHKASVNGCERDLHFDEKSCIFVIAYRRER